MLRSAPSKRTRKYILNLVTLLENNVIKGSSIGDFCTDKNPIVLYFFKSIVLKFQIFHLNKKQTPLQTFELFPCSPGIFGWNFSQQDFRNHS